MQAGGPGEKNSPWGKSKLQKMWLKSLIKHLYFFVFFPPGWGWAGAAAAPQKVAPQRALLPDIWPGGLHGRSGSGLHLCVSLLLYTSCKILLQFLQDRLVNRFTDVNVNLCVCVCAHRCQRRTCFTAGFFLKTPSMPPSVDARSWRKMSASTFLTIMRRSLCPCLTLEGVTPLI